MFTIIEAPEWGWLSASTAAGFGLFGFIFLVTQYFQLVRGYGPLEAGLRTLPVALLSTEAAGIGSGVNDTTRELGGTLGVAVIGSVFKPIYIGALADGPIVGALPPGPGRPPRSRWVRPSSGRLGWAGWLRGSSPR